MSMMPYECVPEEFQEFYINMTAYDQAYVN